MTEKDWPVPINETCLIGPQNGGPAPVPDDCARPGQGDRALFCDRYEYCLNLAAVKDWEGFNCARCPYERKGNLNFCFEQFESMIAEFDDEDEILFDDETEIPGLLDYDFNHEDVLLTLIEVRLENDQPSDG